MREYMGNGYNAYQAAQAAGYSKKDTAAGFRQLRTPIVFEAVQRGLAKVAERYEVDADRIRQGFARIAFDARDVEHLGPTRVERMMALDRLAKISGLYVSKVAFAGVTLEQLLNQADDVEAKLGPAVPPPRLRLIDGGRS